METVLNSDQYPSPANVNIWGDSCNFAVLRNLVLQTWQQKTTRHTFIALVLDSERNAGKRAMTKINTNTIIIVYHWRLPWPSCHLPLQQTLHAVPFQMSLSV